MIDSKEWTSLFERGLRYGEFLERHGSPEQRRRWSDHANALELTAPQRELLARFRRTMRVLCLAGAWCGDCVHQCPILQAFAGATDAIDLKFLDRDVLRDLSHRLRICGGDRVPLAVFLSEDFEFVSLFGDRTLSRYRQLVQQLEGQHCSTGLAVDLPMLQAATQDWLNEFERVQWLLRTSARLRQLHGD